MEKSIVVLMFKNDLLSDCANRRSINLLPRTSTPFPFVILHRLYNTREGHVCEEQTGFRSGLGCVDQIFVLRHILEHRFTFQKPTVIVFLDSRLAFDCVDTSALWQYLLRKGVSEMNISVF